MASTSQVIMQAAVLLKTSGMKRFAVCVLLASLSISCLAQNERRWDEGPVKWSDFTKVDRKEDDLDLKMLVSFQKRDTLVVTDEMNYRYTLVDAVMSDRSWVYYGSMNDRTLAYAQTYFDIAQSYARSYMDSLMFCSDNAKALESRYYKQLRAAEEELHMNGTVSTPVSLGQDIDITRVDYTKSDMANSYSGYVVAGLPLTYLNDLFSGIAGIGGEVDLQYKKIHTMFDVSAGICTINKNNTLDLKSINDSAPIYFSLMVRPGFELPTPHPRVRLTAFTGIGYKVYWYAMKETLDSKRIVTSASGVAISEGIKASFQTGKTQIDFRGSNSTETCHSLDIKVWSDQILMHGGMVPAVFLSFGYSAHFRPLSRSH